MAELTIEQKAERYDEAIKRAKSKIKNDKDYVLYEDDVIEIFPELAESYDERIRKALIDSFTVMKESKNCGNTFSKHNIPVADILVWLEKQGEREKFIKKELINIRGYREEALRRLQELEKQGLQNSSESSEEVELIQDMDKPKFNVGDWVTDDGETYFHIISYVNHTYKVETVEETTSHFQQKFIDRKFRLWSIEDAKAGDVLAAHECLVLFKELDGLNIKCYCTYHFMNTPMFHVDTLQNKSAFSPATRKQQVLFFQKLKEAGYEWNKKELKKIERESSTWSEEDETTKNNISHIIRQYDKISKRDNQPCWHIGDCLLWMQNIKDRVLSEPVELSEKNEAVLDALIRRLEGEDIHVSPHLAIECLRTIMRQKQRKSGEEHYELEEFAKIVRGNLAGISKAVQELFEAKYLQLTGNKMYGGFKD